MRATRSEPPGGDEGRKALELVEFPEDGRGRSRVELVACPYLGLVDDPGTRALFTTPEHRCYAGTRAQVSLEHQSRYCLAAAFEECPAILGANLADVAHESGSGPWRRYAAFGLAAVALAALLLGLRALNATQDSEKPAPPMDPILMPTSTPLAGTISTDADARQSLATVSAVESLTVHEEASMVRLEVPDGMILHVVSPGETLAEIADRYESSIDELRLANGLVDGDILEVGLALIVPLREIENESPPSEEPTPVAEAPQPSFPVVAPQPTLQSSGAGGGGAGDAARPIGSLSPPYHVDPPPSQGAPGAAQPVWTDAIPTR